PDDSAAWEQADAALRRLGVLGLIESLAGGDLRLHRLLAAYVRTRTPDPAADVVAVEHALVAQVAADDSAGNIWAARTCLNHLRHAVQQAGERRDAPAGVLYNGLAEVLYIVGDWTGDP